MCHRSVVELNIWHIYSARDKQILSFYERFCPLRHNLVVPTDIIHDMCVCVLCAYMYLTYIHIQYQQCVDIDR